jgi:hypothetical protein
VLWTLAQGAERTGGGRVYSQNFEEITVNMEDEAVGRVKQLQQIYTEARLFGDVQAAFRKILQSRCGFEDGTHPCVGRDGIMAMFDDVLTIFFNFVERAR